MQIGENIRAMRRRCGFTQEELAAQLSVMPQAVSKWENGNGMPDITQLVPLAQIFGTTTDTLLGGGRSPARPCRAAYGRQCAGTAPAFGCVCRSESKHPQSEIIKIYGAWIDKAAAFGYHECRGFRGSKADQVQR